MEEAFEKIHYVKRLVRIYLAIITLSVATTRPFRKRIALSSSSLFTKCGPQLEFNEVLAL
jgi:hypothetical protein